MSVPTFFFSYARQDDWSNYLSRFYDDLEKTVAQWSGHSLKDQPLGTFDLRIPLGADWSALLVGALSSGSAFVMAETPLYYSREDCGKELRAFLRRSAELGIDESGALTGARNVIRVRWLPEAAYSIPADNRTRIPAILSRIEHTPPQVPDDDDRNAAIRRYARKGMKSCVDLQPYYNELLDAFAEAIVNAADTLPPGEPRAFETEQNAFEFDWRGHFHAPDQLPQQDAAPTVAREPEGLRSIVAFHITHRPLSASADAISFADLLVSESPDDAAVDPRLATILAELRHAALDENLELFNVAPAPPLPFDVQRLADQLRALMNRGVSTLLVVDSEWLLAPEPGTAAGLLRNLIEVIPEWSGAIVIADDVATGAQALVPAEGPFAVPGAYLLPADPGMRAFELRRVLVEARGKAMRSLGSRTGDAQALPLLSSTRSKAA
jgi:hypothetical protein